MAKSNLNTQAKRKRELARKDKRAAKDEKRAARKAEARVARSADEGAAPSAVPVKPIAPQPAAKPSMSLHAAAFIRRMNKTP
jgi:hypothetical protein